MNNLPCDGCGLPASPQHIAERLRRLEVSTQHRPAHIGVLFVALAPTGRPEDDFYGPPQSTQFSGPIFDALDIVSSADNVAAEPDAISGDSVRLIEFQRRGY